MIQRIQTVYMLLSILLMIGLYSWFPQISNENGEVVLQRNHILIAGPVIVSVVLSGISIFNFKNRLRQFVLNRLAIIINFLLLGFFAYRSLTLSGETLVSEKGIGVLFPAISIIFLVLANKAIKRDEDLVKSVDRLR